MRRCGGGARQYLGDLDFIDAPLSLRHNDESCARFAPAAGCPLGCTPNPERPEACELQGLTSKRYAAERRASLSRPLMAAPIPVPPGVPAGNWSSVYAKSPEWGHRGTTHVSITDRWGNVVSMTTTIEENMGDSPDPTPPFPPPMRSQSIPPV